MAVDTDMALLKHAKQELEKLPIPKKEKKKPLGV